MIHKMMIEQGEHYAILRLNDARTPAMEKKGAYGGTWKESDDTSSGEVFGFKKDNLPSAWEFFHGTLKIGTRSTSQGSHKEGEDPAFLPDLILNDVKREASGKLGKTGSGALGSKTGPMQKGAIVWTVVRYEF